MYTINSNQPPAHVLLDSRYARIRQPYAFSMVSPIQAPQGQVFLVHVEEFLAINTIPNVRATNQHLSVHVGGTLFTAVIPEGHYTMITLKNKLHEWLDPVGINVILDTVNYKLQFVSAQAFAIIHTPTHPTTIGKVIGLDVDMTNQFTFPYESGIPLHTLIPANPVNLIATQYLSLSIDELQVENYTVRQTPQVFIRIPMDATFGQQVVYRPTVHHYQPVHNRSMEAFTVQVLLDDNTPAPLSFDFVLMFGFQYMYPAADQDSQEGTIPWFYRTVLKTPIETDNFEEVEELGEED